MRDVGMQKEGHRNRKEYNRVEHDEGHMVSADGQDEVDNSKCDDLRNYGSYLTLEETAGEELKREGSDGDVPGELGAQKGLGCKRESGNARKVNTEGPKEIALENELICTAVEDLRKKLWCPHCKTTGKLVRNGTKPKIL